MSQPRHGTEHRLSGPTPSGSPVLPAAGDALVRHEARRAAASVCVEAPPAGHSSSHRS